MKFALYILFAVAHSQLLVQSRGRLPQPCRRCQHLEAHQATVPTSKPIIARAQIFRRGITANRTVLLPVGEIMLLEITNNNGSIFVQLFGGIRGIIPPNAKHGMHIYEKPDYSAGCYSVGEHFNPTNSPHGDISQPLGHRHVGDLGNVRADRAGMIHIDIKDNLIRLSNGPNSVVGRPIVIHAGKDDLGLTKTDLSKIEGSSGIRWACGTIELVQRNAQS